jgi:hypothetical protein
MNQNTTEVTKLKLLQNGAIVVARHRYGNIADIGDVGVAVDAPTSIPVNHEGLKILVTSRGYIVVDEAEVEATGKTLKGASFDACNAARLSGLLQRALIDGELVSTPDVDHRDWLANLKEGDVVGVPYSLAAEDIRLMTVYENNGEWIRLLPEGFDRSIHNTVLVNAGSGVLHYAPVRISPPGASNRKVTLAPEAGATA